MRNKNNIRHNFGKRIIPVILIAISALYSCNGMLDVDTNRLTPASEYDLSGARDSLYAIIGIESALQKIADSYVLLGELRGDLLDISSFSDASLKEINNFDMSSENPCANKKDYYDVINNCNYVLEKMDTSIVDRGLKLRLQQYAAIKTIRAWVYMQLALTYKTAVYLEKPILTVEDAEKDYSANEVDMTQLADKLINDLQPLSEVEYSWSSSIFPIQFVLGDLYLWRGSLTGNTADYENAALQYRTLMYKYYITLNGYRDANLVPLSYSYISYWIPVNNTISSEANLYWIKSLTSEAIAVIPCPTEYGQTFKVDTLNNARQIVPSAVAIHNWDSQIYYLNEASNTTGDLRKFGSISFNAATNDIVYTALSDYSFTGATINSNYCIYKYKVYQKNIVVYRSSLLYLRYAEAVNRLNKPNLAFAVIKYGLNSANLVISDKIIPANERESPTPDYMNFNDYRFTSNVGTRMRGLGNTDKDTTFYKIPRLDTKADSILFVEDKIQEELALETAFEGNRFQDLMRITLRRIKNGEGDESYLADKVAAKHNENKEAIKQKLMNISNWYIQK